MLSPGSRSQVLGGGGPRGGGEWAHRQPLRLQEAPAQNLPAPAPRSACVAPLLGGQRRRHVPETAELARAKAGDPQALRHEALGPQPWPWRGLPAVLTPRVPGPASGARRAESPSDAASPRSRILHSHQPPVWASLALAPNVSLCSLVCDSCGPDCA